MFIGKRSCTLLVGLLWSFSSLVMAGTFTPVAGTTIASSAVSIGWTSTAIQQYVRAYDSSGDKIFDSGRQFSSTGQVNFTVAASETLLRVIFYEKTADGSWVPNERIYNVSIGGTTGDGISEDTLANLNCTNGQVAKYNGTVWQCAADDDTDTLSGLNCNANETAITDSSGNWSCTAVPTTPDVEDTVAAIEAMFCSDGEALHRGVNDELRCGVLCPYLQDLTASGLTVDFRLDIGNGYFITEDVRGSCSATNDGPLSNASLKYNPSSSIGSGWELSIDPGPFAVDEVELLEPLEFNEAKACAVWMGCESVFDVY